jgi:hypothetical protein
MRWPMTEWKKHYYSGICMCGHAWNDHHLGYVLNLEAFEATGEGTLAQECEYYGCNETGGMAPSEKSRPVPDPVPDDYEDWPEMVDHCFGYTDRDNPDEAERLRWHGTVKNDVTFPVCTDSLCSMNGRVHAEPCIKRKMV